ncbi:MAG: hypothetical protein HY060_07740 [Proteobacteria bacterium]|nr:hypothetical protein [Pseudomonadota bacterium]
MTLQQLVIAVLIVLIGAFPAGACSRAPDEPEPTVANFFASAKQVFLAPLIRTEEVRHNDPVYKDIPYFIEGRYRIIEILKGQPSADGAVRDLPWGPGNCSLGLLAGHDYLFFVDQRGLVLLPDGSRMFFSLEVQPVKQLLAKLRSLSNR